MAHTESNICDQRGQREGLTNKILSVLEVALPYELPTPVARLNTDYRVAYMPTYIATCLEVIDMCRLKLNAKKSSL